MKLGKPGELHKQSRLHPLSSELDELAALARMTAYVKEQLVVLAPRSASIALELQKSIEADLTEAYRKGSASKTNLN